MAINRTNIKQLTKDARLKHNYANTSADVLSNLLTSANEVETHLQVSSIEKTSNWLLQNDLWLQNEKGSIGFRFRNYSRGDVILELDLGTVNLGTEIRYPHPCVVLYDQDEDWVVVAPITHAQLKDGQPVAHHPFEVLVKRQPSPPACGNEFQFLKDSVIQVDQIRRVSKRRAYNANSKKLRLDLLNQIDNVILENFTPKKHTLLEKLKDDIQNKDAEIAKLKEQCQELLAKLEIADKKLNCNLTTA